MKERFITFLAIIANNLPPRFSTRVFPMPVIRRAYELLWIECYGIEAYLRALEGVQPHADSVK